MSPSTSRRVLLRHAVVAATGLSAAGLLAACGASAPAATTTGSATAAAVTKAPATASQASAATTSQATAAALATTTTTATVSAKATTSAAPKANVAKGKVWMTYWGSTADDQYMNAIGGSFTKASGAAVTAQNVPGDYVGTITTFLAAGTAPDVAVFTNDMVPELLRQSAFTDMQPLIGRDKLDTSDFVPAALKAYQYKGGLFALPKNFHSYAIWYNIDSFQQAALQPPTAAWTLDSYLEASQKLTNTSRGTFGTTMPVSQFTEPWIWLDSGDIVDNPDNVTKITFSNAKTVQALQWLADLRTKYHVTPTAAESAADKGDTNMFYNGKIGMYPYLYVEGRVAAFAKGFTWDVGPMPTGPDGQHATVIATGGYFLPKGSANPDLGWQFVKSATSVDSMKQDAKIGIGIPARLSAATWPEFQAGPPKNKNVFIDQAKYGRLGPVFLGVGPVLGAAWKALAPLFAGASTAADAVAKADAAANAELQKYVGK